MEIMEKCRQNETLNYLITRAHTPNTSMNSSTEIKMRKVQKM